MHEFFIFAVNIERKKGKIKLLQQLFTVCSSLIRRPIKIVIKIVICKETQSFVRAARSKIYVGDESADNNTEFL